MNRREILDGFSEQADRQLVARVLDKISQVQKNYEMVFTRFLDPHQEQVAQRIVRSFRDLEYQCFGGYEAAERCLLAIFPDYMDVNEEDFPLQLVKISGNMTYHKVNHRDYLGAILGLGITREMIGDLLVMDEGCQVIVKQEVADYILANLEQVGRASVTVEQREMNELILPSFETKEIRTTVSSLRLDAVASAGFGLSRTKVVPLIKGEKVRLNWETKKDPAAVIQAGDVISIKGKGRIKVEEVGGKTRKDRLFLCLKRFV